MPIKLKTGGQNGLELKAPIKQLGGGAVDSVNGMTGDVVLDIPSKTSDLINDTNFITQSELDSKGYLTEHQDISALATKSEVAEIESKIPNLEGYATEQWVEGKGYLTEHQSLENYATRSEIPTKTSELTNDSGYLTEHQSLAAYATKTELETKQDKLTAGDNITITDGVISASASGGDSIKSIAFSTNQIITEVASYYKEALTYLWGNGRNGAVDLSKCIVTIDGVVATHIYIFSPYIYFCVPVSADFSYDTSRQLNQYKYYCRYDEAIAATSTYTYITKLDYADVLLSSRNYAQYINTRGTYTTDISDSNLYNAQEAHIHIITSDNRNAFVNIMVPEYFTIGSKQNDYYYFPESENSNGYLYYDGNSFNISNGNAIDYIWYK